MVITEDENADAKGGAEARSDGETVGMKRSKGERKQAREKKK